jgi:hypothetical protein
MPEGTRELYRQIKNDNRPGTIKIRRTTMSMTKSEIINSIYENLGISKKDSIRIVESVF